MLQSSHHRSPKVHPEMVKGKTTAVDLWWSRRGQQLHLVSPVLQVCLLLRLIIITTTTPISCSYGGCRLITVGVFFSLRDINVSVPQQQHHAGVISPACALLVGKKAAVSASCWRDSCVVAVQASAVLCCSLCNPKKEKRKRLWSFGKAFANQDLILRDASGYTCAWTPLSGSARKHTAGEGSRLPHEPSPEAARALASMTSYYRSTVRQASKTAGYQLFIVNYPDCSLIN